jgi:Acyclic terpene utilisation family protein AtuA
MTASPQPGMTSEKIVRIGGASAFWGDSAVGPIQLVERADVDYLIFDYLAETTMAILASAKSKDAALGYATDFVDIAMKSVLPSVAKKHIKVVANAGGLNPRGCAAALQALAKNTGVTLKIAVVEGDDINGRLKELPTLDLDDESIRVSVPPGTLSANAYLGALPIARAFAAGADIVVTGRCVDSALTLGALIHEYGWSIDQHDLLAAGSLAGHIIECGCQATGGLFTDWDTVPDWANIGYPVIECRRDGSFCVTKPAGTGGLICAAAVAEQMLYEIGDPTRYLLPDVTCDFSQVTIEQLDGEHVRVAGALGSPPSPHYKVSATYRDGYRSSGTMIIIGIDAAAKARRTAEAILERTRGLLKRAGLPDYSSSNIEVIGAETLYGPHARTPPAREVMMRVTVTHSSKEALTLFGREIAPSGTSWSPGTTMPPGPRPSPSPLIRQFSFLVPKRAVPVTLMIDDQVLAVEIPLSSQLTPAAPAAREDTAVFPAEDSLSMPLVALAYARSGDKGERSNIGVIARRPEYLPLIGGQLTASAVREYFAHLVAGPVQRFSVPGIKAFNFLLDRALPGGGSASLRMDPLGKGMGQMLLDFPIQVPRELAARAAQESRRPASPVKCN